MPTLLDSFPVGTIIPYFGSNSFTELMDLFQAGWIPCDGSAYSAGSSGPHALPDLALVLGLAWGGQASGGHVLSFNVPELQNGEFLRGVNYGAQTPTGNPIDPDVGSRIARNGGYAGNHVASFQGFATGAPNNQFMSSAPNQLHQHGINHYFTSYTEAWCKYEHDDYFLRWDDQNTVDAAGNHTHAVSAGGDPATRPRCASVYFLIKYRDVTE